MARNLHAEITNRILAHLKEGVAPWRQSWSSKGTGAMPRNASTGRAYSGVNVPLLWCEQQERGFASSGWLTFKQARAAGGSVRKGEKGSTVVFVSTIEREDEQTGKLRKIPFLKAYTVFNVEQCDDLPAHMLPQAEPINADRRDELAEEFLAATGAKIRHGEGRAYYRRSEDIINLPIFASFVSADRYYGTAFHELAHWTGAEHRLNRIKGKKFGDQEYTYEELVAELASAFLSAEFGYDNDQAAASYLDGWIKFLADHETAFMSAASDASKAVAYLRELALAEASAEPVQAEPIAAEPVQVAARAIERPALRRAVQDFDTSALPLFGDQARQLALF
jgi:antirestriction protein ArdC